MLFNADFARACIEPTKVFSIENILETYARQNIIDGFKVKEIPIDDRSHLFENTVNLLISW